MPDKQTPDDYDRGYMQGLLHNRRFYYAAVALSLAMVSVAIAIASR